MVMKLKKKLLIAVYNLEIGGIERSLINMLENMDYQKVDVDLLIYHHTGELIGAIPEQVNVIPQIEQYTTFRKSIKQCFKEGHYFIGYIRVLCKLLTFFNTKLEKLEEGSGYIQMQLAQKYSMPFLPALPKKYDLAISYAWPHDIVANKVKALKKIAWVHTDYTKLEIDNAIDLSIWNKFNYIASVSEDCLKSFLAQYPTLKDKAMVIENLTSPIFIKEMSRKENEPSFVSRQNFNIISVGRLSYVKGFDIAIEALKILHDKGYKNITWHVVGYGGYESELKERINKNNLVDSFLLLGKKTNPYFYMKECDLYVQPSRYEGKAVTVTEAMILGKPVLITDYPTAHSQVKHGIDGYICELSSKGLAEAIEKLYTNSHLRKHVIKYIEEKDYSNRYELEKLYSLIS
jgi:glycosyltransferase involved in cell wall biosynthesis